MLVLHAALALSATLAAEDCPPPVVQPAPGNLFPQREVDLGDAIAAQKSNGVSPWSTTPP